MSKDVGRFSPEYAIARVRAALRIERHELAAQIDDLRRQGKITDYLEKRLAEIDTFLLTPAPSSDSAEPEEGRKHEGPSIDPGTKVRR